MPPEWLAQREAQRPWTVRLAETDNTSTLDFESTSVLQKAWSTTEQLQKRGCKPGSARIPTGLERNHLLSSGETINPVSIADRLPKPRACANFDGMDLEPRTGPLPGQRSNWHKQGFSMQSAPFELSPSQKIQVTLLYHYASLDYLKELRLKLQALMIAVNPTLELSKMQRRNALFTASQHGTREMSENWRNDACSILMHFERSVERLMTERASDSFSITIANGCERSLREISLAWMTPDEQDNFDNQFQAISWHAGQLDNTVSQHEQAGRWDDFSLMLAASGRKHDIDRADPLRLRPDILGVSGTTPARTGVYLPFDDPYGTPQFCWIGNPQGVLLDCNTFNELGLEALASIGRDDLWINKSRMLEFARRHANDPRLRQDPFFDDSISDEDLASSLVARNAFTTRPCRWMYVEKIHGALKNLAEVKS